MYVTGIMDLSGRFILLILAAGIYFAAAATLLHAGKSYHSITVSHGQDTIHAAKG